MKVAIIGAGNMGGAIARGLASGHYIKAEEISVSNPSNGKRKKFLYQTQATENGRPSKPHIQISISPTVTKKQLPMQILSLLP